MSIVRFISHSYKAASIASAYGWLPGARYTNLRDVRRFDRLEFLDIDWRNYSFRRHLQAVVSTKPMMTVAQDIEVFTDLNRIIDQAHELSQHCDFVVIVPKHRGLSECMEELIPQNFIFGYSVPTKYGATSVPAKFFSRPVHLLGGRPDVQRKLADQLRVFSIDCNRFTLDARFGDYFDGEIFRPHPFGGYERCIESSIQNINSLWLAYDRNRAGS